LFQSVTDLSAVNSNFTHILQCQSIHGVTESWKCVWIGQSNQLGLENWPWTVDSEQVSSCWVNPLGGSWPVLCPSKPGSNGDRALLHNWATGRLIRPSLLLTSAWGVTKKKEFRVFVWRGCFLSLSWHWKPPSILSSCYAQYYSLWGSFTLMISILLRKSESLGIEVMFFVFSYVWWKMVWVMELDSGARLQEASNFPS
jgi:hypothetical protein